MSWKDKLPKCHTCEKRLSRMDAKACPQHKVMRDQLGKKNHLWKGDGASYSSIHKWVYRHWGKAKECESCNCKAERFTWANLSKEYRRERDDWMQLCYSCHVKLDRYGYKV